MGKKEGGLGWGGGKMELGALNRREGGGREYVFDSKKKKKSQFGPPVLCRTFSFDPPLLSLLPPTTTTTPPTHTHTDTQGPADLQDITPASLFYLLHRDACFLIYIFTVWCVYVHTVATGRL